MAQIITRSTSGVGATAKNGTLTVAEMDQNFIGLNSDIYTDNFPVIRPSLVLNFIGTRVLDPLINFTRGSPATQFNSSGVLTTVGNNTPRLDYNPVTLAPQGLLIEESRTNSIRNNTMQGAVAGTPGTPPNNWQISATGLTRTVVGTGTSGGINYIDIRFQGTTGSVVGAIYFEGTSSVAATNGQTWSLSSWVSLISGSLANVNLAYLAIDQFSSLPAYLSPLSTTVIGGSLTSSLQRFTNTPTTNDPSVASVRPYIGFTWNQNVSIDFTLRIGLPQLEQGASATSVIPTTTAAITRSADDARVNVLSPWYNQSAGTLFVERIQQPLDPAGKRYINISDGGAGANAAMQKYQTNTGASGTVSYNNGNGNFDPTPTGVPPQGAIVKTALAIDNTGKAASRDGGTVATTSILPPLTGMTTMFIGSQIGAGNNQASNTWIRRITYYPRRLPNEQLQALTGS